MTDKVIKTQFGLLLIVGPGGMIGLDEWKDDFYDITYTEIATRMDTRVVICQIEGKELAKRMMKNIYSFLSGAGHGGLDVSQLLVKMGVTHE